MEDSIQQGRATDNCGAEGGEAARAQALGEQTADLARVSPGNACWHMLAKFKICIIDRRRQRHGRGRALSYSLTSARACESVLRPRARATATAMARGAAEDTRARTYARAALDGSASC